MVAPVTKILALRDTMWYNSKAGIDEGAHR
jgi:hypothetical protein